MSITTTDTRQTIPLMVDLLQNHIHYLTLNPLFGNNRSQYSRCVQIIVASLIDYMQSEMCGNLGITEFSFIYSDFSIHHQFILSCRLYIWTLIGLDHSFHSAAAYIIN